MIFSFFSIVLFLLESDGHFLAWNDEDEDDVSRRRRSTTKRLSNHLDSLAQALRILRGGVDTKMFVTMPTTQILFYQASTTLLSPRTSMESQNRPGKQKD
jgi:hypothetical protein